jgi:phasin
MDIVIEIRHAGSARTATPGETAMNVINEQFIKQAEKLMQDARLPENLQVFAQDSVAKSREAFTKLAAAAADQAKVVESVTAEAQVGARALGEKAMSNLARNTQAAFDAAEALARAKSLPEAAKLQADFMQAQFAAMGAQTKEFFELSTKMAQQTFETIGGVAAKGFEQSKGYAQPAFTQAAASFTQGKAKR